MMSLLAMSACQNKDTNIDDNKETIIIGYDEFEPYTYLDLNGDMAGIDVEIAKEAFRELGIDVQFKLIVWEDKDEYLKNGEIDCLWSCFTMTGREDKYDWVGPYMYSRQVVAVQSDSDIYSLNDLKDKSIAVQATTKAETVFLNPEEYNLPNVKKVVSLSTTEEIFAMLRKGYVDAIAGHGALINQLVNNGSGAYRTLEESFYISELGVAFEKGSHSELIKQLTEVLKTMQEDGRLAKIAEKYNLDPEKVVTGVSINEK